MPKYRNHIVFQAESQILKIERRIFKNRHCEKMAQNCKQRQQVMPEWKLLKLKLLRNY